MSQSTPEAPKPIFTSNDAWTVQTDPAAQHVPGTRMDDVVMRPELQGGWTFDEYGNGIYVVMPAEQAVPPIHMEGGRLVGSGMALVVQASRVIAGPNAS